MLYGDLMSCFKQQNLPRFLNLMRNNNADELKLLVKLLIFKFTVWNTGSSYGMALQNLKITGKSVQIKKLVLLGLIVGNYSLKKLESYIYSTEEDSKTVEFLKRHLIKLQNMFKTLSFVNFLLFLVQGQFPTLVSRFLNFTLSKLSVNSISMNDTENISYEFQNRQLVWNTLTEFLIFIIPMLKISNFHRFFRNKTTESDSVLIDKKPLNRCAICIQEKRDIHITTPYMTNCSHVYCYICIMTKLEKFNESNKNQSVHEYWKCLECGSEVRWCTPFEDVDDSAILVKTNSHDSEFEPKLSQHQPLQDQTTHNYNTGFFSHE